MSSSVNRPALLASTGGLLSGGLLGRHRQPAGRKLPSSRTAALFDVGPLEPGGLERSPQATGPASEAGGIASEAWSSAAPDLCVLSLGAAQSG